MNAETLLVAIVTWNSAGSIEACLRSVLGQTRKPDAVWIYDNASSDDTKAILDRYRNRIEVICSDQNRGFCIGHNAIIEATRSDFVLMVNPDIRMNPEYAERTLAWMRIDSKIGAVCGLLLQDDNRGREVVDGTGLILSRSRRFLLRDHGRPLTDATQTAGQVFGCDGALPLFRRAMIEDISIDGLFFDPAFFAHKEDHDVAWRSRLLGWETVFEPSAIATHPRAFRPSDLGLRRRLSPEIKYHTVKNDLLMLLKNEHAAGFWRDFFFMLPRRLAIAFYSLIFEQRSLSAYWYVFRNFKLILQQRNEIQRRRRTSDADIDSWMI